ncbi:hypothetical protein DY245_42785 [Streptomyces inhibens]|uniref:AMP-dependent synthetase/ligase domain-containing protein n=1 Tax=Streptomyces inhibens TaxID=2293571 RepID=A0A371PPP6_STRIH|nr:AMP-binding protein [Streptomyces inhibens]REK84494.1 hypothetical protein DY245_42785 [Streptomyces inhibens]
MPKPDHVDVVRTHPPVHDVVAAVSRELPARTAVRTGTDAVTYRELDLWAGQIARRLAAAGVGRGDRVGVLVEPSPALVAAMLGVLRAGCAYVPLDPCAPLALSPAALRCAVLRRSGARRLARLGLSQLPTLAVERHGTLPETGDAAGNRREPVIHRSAPDDPACVARPGGVGLTHAQLSAATAVRRALCPGTPVLLLAAPLTRDFAVAGLWATLTAGGRLILAGEEETRDREAVAGLVERHRVTQLLCTPALFGEVLEASAESGVQRLRTLDTVTLTGGPLPPSLAERHEAVLGGAVALVDVNPPAFPRHDRYAGPGPLAAVGPDARGRFGRPDAVVRRLALPLAGPQTNTVPTR